MPPPQKVSNPASKNMGSNQESNTIIIVITNPWCSDLILYYSVFKLLIIRHSRETYQPLTVEQRCAAASSDGPVAEVEHMVNLLSQLGGILVLRDKPHSALFGHTLDRNWDYSGKEKGAERVWTTWFILISIEHTWMIKCTALSQSHIH